MSDSSRQQYLESKVFTASQPQLHLMLLDGALRFGTQARDAWTESEGFAAADSALERMFDIVEELLQGLASGEGEISEQLAEQYAFVYRELAACRINADKQRLETCLELLTYQRETWKLASERIDAEQPATPKPAKLATPHMDTGSTQPVAGFSFEA